MNAGSIETKVLAEHPQGGRWTSFKSDDDSYWNLYIVGIDGYRMQQRWLNQYELWLEAVGRWEQTHDRFPWESLEP
jgi:hypothetical protein